MPIGVALDQSYASFRKRILAFIYDYLLIAVYLVILIIAGISLFYSRYGADARALFFSPISGEIVGFLTLTLPVVLYFTLEESSKKQATWGKRRVGLLVTDMNGIRISIKRSLVRSAVKFTPWELSHAIIFRIPGAFGITSEASPFPPVLGVGFVVVWVLIILYIISVFISRKHQTLYDRIAGTIVLTGALHTKKLT